MSILRRLYASGGNEIIYDTVTISDGVQTYRLVKGFENMILGGVEFEGAGIDIAIPKRSATGTQNLVVAIDNTSGIPGKLLRDAQRAKRQVVVTFRQFTSDNPSTDAQRPLQFAMKSATITNGKLQITAGYFDLLNTAWPRRLYTLNKFRGLTYL
ncbi:DUF1833 family protein [Ectopseudomonas mendocina]|uniref:DUF1833 family protein n=1 Tax=Ectopseudomonas mendocina TaxID=300 RepID=A0ABZ2RA73_ECTME